MAYIEENMKLRHAQNSSTPDPEAAPKYLDPQEELYRLSEKYKVEKKAQPNEEGSVTNSLAMLTAIPEVDLGMEYVLLTETHNLWRPVHASVDPQHTTEEYRRDRKG